MRGSRYGICGRPLRGLLPFVREAVGVPIYPAGEHCPTPVPPDMPPSRLLQSPEFSGALGRGGTASAGGGMPIVPAEGVRDFDRGGRVPGSGGGEEGERQSLLKWLLESLEPHGFTVEKVSLDWRERARHGKGHSLSDIWALRSGELGRVPDGVVWPDTEEQVSALMVWAGQANVCLIPFGGGTSVTRAVECPPLEVEPRPIISVDMRRMCLILSVDKSGATAHVQAGIVGAQLSEELAKRGLTMGHEPDSLEFSTLGGWIATRASGMKRSRYGNIEDLVLEVRVVTGQGLAWQHTDREGVCHSTERGGLSYSGDGKTKKRPKGPGPFSRTSVGVDLVSTMLGSEGCLGIVTSAVVKVFPLPETSQHGSAFFRDFSTGVAFCRELAQISGRLGLASVRLLDNRQLRLGKALKGDDGQPGDTNSLRSVITKAAPAVQMLWIKLMKGWEPVDMSGVTLVFEGTKREVAIQREEVSRLVKTHGGIAGGASSGKAGYDLTFAIAYLRDFALGFNVLGESFETFVAWPALECLCKRVKSRLEREHGARGLRGKAFVTHRVTQLYPEGACVYFYLAIYAEGLQDPPGVFAELEEAARDEILAAGGSLSHHHGVGKTRAAFMSRVTSPAVTAMVEGMKKALDPEGVLGARNNLLSASSVLTI
ncbi:unnamed protein product [Discosporangium mesarthrocarpum]